jgi:hypothetical protein
MYQEKNTFLMEEFWLGEEATTLIIQEIGSVSRLVCKRWKKLYDQNLNQFTKLQHIEVQFLFDGIHQTTTLSRIHNLLDYLHENTQYITHFNFLEEFHLSDSKFKPRQPYIVTTFRYDRNTYWYFGKNGRKRGEIKVRGHRLKYYLSINGKSKINVRKEWNHDAVKPTKKSKKRQYLKQIIQEDS